MRASVIALVLMPLASIGASAHPHEYVGGSDTRWTFPTSCPAAEEAGPGFVCFPQGEICCSPATFSIFDDISGNASGFFCQDFNDDSVCGDDGTIAIIEPGVSFCNSVSVTNWDGAFPLYVFIDGPVRGSPGFSACGATQSYGTHGFVSHDGEVGVCPPDCPPQCPPNCLPPGCPPDCGGPVVDTEPPGATLLPVSATGSALVSCVGTVQVNFTNDVSLLLPGARVGSATPCSLASAPCETYLTLPGVISCIGNRIGCCTPLFAPSAAGGPQVACVRSTNVRIDLNGDGMWEYVLPAATVTGPPC